MTAYGRRKPFPPVSPHEAISIIIPLAFFLLLALKFHLPQNMWQDELCHIGNTAFSSLSSIAASFNANHVAYDMLLSLLFKLFGIKNLHQAIDSAPYLRLFPLAIALLTVGCVYRIALFFSRPHAGIVVAILLLSNIPFLNFATSLRGYNLTLLLLSLLVLSMWLHEESGGKYHLFAIAMLTALLLYTIPSNVYYVIALCFHYLCALMSDLFGAKRGDRRAPWPRTLLHNSNTLILLSVATGILLSIAAYYPIMGELIATSRNKYVGGKGWFRLETITWTAPVILQRYFSHHYLLLIPLAGGAFWAINAKRVNRHVICCLMLALLPFAISFVRGDTPADRAFSPGIPFFLLAMSFFISCAIEKITINTRRLISMVFISIACSLTFISSFWHANAKVMEARLAQVPGPSGWAEPSLTQNLLMNYYQVDFFPYQTVKAYVKPYEKRAYIYGVTEATLEQYFSAVGKPALRIKDLRDLFGHGDDEVMVVTVFPRRFLETIHALEPGIETRPLTSTSSYAQVFLVKRQPR